MLDSGCLILDAGYWILDADGVEIAAGFLALHRQYPTHRWQG